MNPLASAKHRLILSTAVLGIIATLLAAAGDGLEMPLTKLFAADAEIFMSISFLSLGGVAGMLLTLLFGRKSKVVFNPNRHLQKKDTWKLISTAGFTLLSNFLIMTGLQQESAGTASLLQTVMTISMVLFAALFLREKISKHLGIGVALIVLGSVALSITNPETLSFSTGSLFIIGGYIAAGVLFTITKLLADRNPAECNLIRCLGSGAAGLLIAFCLGEQLPSLQSALGLMVTGFIAGGLANMLLIYGQRYLGAAKAGAIFGLSPLLGVLFAFSLLGEIPTASLLAALILFIPGIYFVLMKSSGKAAEQKPDDEVVREDAKYFKSISEEKKSGMRNQLTSFGFLIVALFFVMMALSVLSSGTADAIDVFSGDMLIPGLVFGIFLLITGAILLILGKRVLTAVTFILMVAQMLAFVFIGNIHLITAVTGIFSLIFALILLTSKSPQKYAFAAVNALFGAAFISYLFSDVVCGIIVGIASVFLIWLSLVCSTGKLQRSVAKHLTEDGDMTFSRCGAVIGFLLAGEITVIELVYDYFMDAAIYATDAFLAFGTVNALLTAFVGAMLLFIGKRQMTAVFFFGISVAMFFELFCDGAFLYMPVIFELVFGLLVILRGASLILPTAVLFGDAFAILLYLQSETMPEVQTAMLLLSLMCAAVALYLAFAVFSEKPKLPVF